MHLREKGYVTVSSVFEDDSVDAYLELIRTLIRRTGNERWPFEVPLDDPVTVDPLRAPRLPDSDLRDDQPPGPTFPVFLIAAPG